MIRRTPLKRSRKPIKRSPLRRISAKQRKRISVIANLRREKIERYGPWYQIRLPGCTGREQGIHHIKKKSHGGEDTHENTLLACNSCNMAIEDNPKLAAELGFTVSKKYS